MINLNSLVTFFGQRGTGKSNAAAKLSRLFPRLVVFDTKGEYSRESVDEKGIRLFSGNVAECETLQGFAQSLKANAKRNQYRILFKCEFEEAETEKHAGELFNRAIEACYRVGDLAVFVDEAQIWYPGGNNPLLQSSKRFITMGRSRGLGGIFVTQRPAELNKTLISQSEHIFSGRLFEKNDMEYLRAVMGDQAERVTELPNFRFMHFEPGKGAKVVAP